MTKQTNNSQTDTPRTNSPRTDDRRTDDSGSTRNAAARRSPATVLVTSATGKTGRRVAERLAARGVTVRAGSRSGATPFDWEAPETWAPALRGADAGRASWSSRS